MKQVMVAKKLPSLSNLKRFVSFLSFSGSGHSLISSMIDAHKNAVVSREQLVLLKVYEGKFDRDRAIRVILSASNYYTAMGRMHRGSGTSHKVPEGRNGSSSDIHLVGDKHGHGTVCYISNKPRFLQKVSKVLRLPILFIHVYRNPYDVIAHTQKFYPRFGVSGTTEKVINRYKMTDGVINSLDSPVHSIKIEDFVFDVPKHMTKVIDFLHLPKPQNGYLKGCAKIVNPRLLHERGDVEWAKEDLEKVEELCKSIPYLNSYSFQC